VPGAIYNRAACEEALGRLADGGTLEGSASDCRDPNRIADPSTIRRWFWRRIENLRFFSSPIILAWDWRAAARILIVERASP
jgi:hypothetical protein